ncbi:beta-ketoacyl-ACP synthase II [Clostridium sp.]|uniref:beta-ketoacyl-ACP synthase II n=1 Tax=Clostridium sp. TaxID=1506 RepID=UPI000EC23B29|nr:beta-ketoacyl-ACP synthase II [Clostridium sp.]HCQ89090.1 beta-ketoacyl-[acyl-carrier-protein] synthase II [Clostridium sp.]
MDRRVVITGMGALTPLGNNLETFWNGIKDGKCGIDFIKTFDVSNFKAKVAGELKDFNIEDYMDKKEAKRMDKYCQYAMVAAEEAIKNSNLDIESLNKEKFGVIIGSGIGGLETITVEYKKLMEKGPNRVSPFMIPMIIGNIAAGNVAIKYGAKGICSTVVTACATGTNAIGEAFEMIKSGRADVIIAGGCEAPIVDIAMAGFSSLTALTKSEDPLRASIPFDKERNGFVMGEGAGIVILESLDHAKSREARIYGEMLGYGATGDAFHITQPSPDGEGAARAMKMAIEEAQIEASDVSYINAHGTSTPYNDKFETLAIKSVFGEEAYKIPISSTKSMIGHLLGAAGAVEAIVCIKSLEEGFIPPTIGLKIQDEDCDLDYVPNVGRSRKLKYALSNSLGFGGHNASILLKKWEE